MLPLLNTIRLSSPRRPARLQLPPPSSIHPRNMAEKEPKPLNYIPEMILSLQIPPFIKWLIPLSCNSIKTTIALLLQKHLV
ncbi:hypothetical protein K1719_020691 [Acacia pycnantha]|nr:hypothetical protein K1719_020691 [Acacia pycnantha]